MLSVVFRDDQQRLTIWPGELRLPQSLQSWEKVSLALLAARVLSDRTLGIKALWEHPEGATIRCWPGEGPTRAGAIPNYSFLVCIHGNEFKGAQD